MRNHFFLLAAVLVSLHSVCVEAEDREALFGDRVRRSMNGEPSSSGGPVEDPFARSRRLLYSDLGIVPEVTPLKIEFLSEGETFAQMDARSAEDIRFEFYGDSPKAFSLHFVELGFFLKGGSEGMSKGVRKDPNPLSSDIHFNSIYAAARSFLGILRGYEKTYGSRLEPSKDSKEGLDTLKAMVPNGWTAQAFDETPMSAVAVTYKVCTNRYHYQLYSTSDRGNFLTGYVPSTWPLKTYPEVFGLGKQHADRLAKALYPIGALSFCEEHRKAQKKKGVLWQPDLEASGDWKHWRREVASGDYVRDYECLEEHPVSFSERFLTEAEREAALQKQMSQATWTGRD